MTALVLTYHAIEAGPAPLCLDRGTFERHIDVLAEANVETLTIGELAAAVRRRAVPERAVVLTFDDAFASAVHVAAPMLAERGMRATFFCVAAHLGGTNDWPTQNPRAPRLPLADTPELAALARSGFEIGSHGMTHAPLDPISAQLGEYELVGSKEALETALGVNICSIAYPYGVPPSEGAAVLVSAHYTAACTTRLDTIGSGSRPLALPRVDAHYVRSPRLLRHAVTGSLGPYLTARRAGAAARRMLFADYNTTRA